MLNRKRLENRITLKGFVEAIEITSIVEAYVFECGHTEYEEFDIEFGHLYTIDEFDGFEINEETKELKLYRNTRGQCEECEWLYSNFREDEIEYFERIYCDEMPQPEGFEHVVKYHGLAAYSGSHTPKHAIENAKELIANPSWEVCCSTRPIGPIGLVIDGITITASNVDLCTHVDVNNGRRYYEVDSDSNNRASRGIIHYAYQLQKKWDHDEIVTKDNKPAAIWIKDWAIEDFKDAADILCEEYNLELVIIKTEEDVPDPEDLLGL